MSRETATKVAWAFLGTPYRWAGDDPSGFDCSGLVVEILQSVGVLPRNGDWSSRDLYREFQAKEVHRDIGEGCLVFYSNARGHIIHVEYCLDDTLSIGASGGGSATDTPEKAWESNAFVKVRPFRSRSGISHFVDPFKD